MRFLGSEGRLTTLGGSPMCLSYADHEKNVFPYSDADWKLWLQMAQ